MNGSRREQRSERSKKVDKMTADTHREFLDMDTDEEDFGRQESSEAEEELPPEPERPAFGEQEIVTLVKYVKNLTTLPSLKETDWNEKCEEVIREYFSNPSQLMLSIFYRENLLTASLGLPEFTVNGFTYFSRSPWQIYTAENFFATVSFGSINKAVENSALKFMENIYASVALESDDWPQIIKNELFSNLHDFLVCLTEEVCKPTGLTVLYVPRERLMHTFRERSDMDYLVPQKCENESAGGYEEIKELFGRLEKIVWHWIREIRDVTKAMPVRKNIGSIDDEVDYWRAKYSNLSCLSKQLSNADLCLIVEILRNFRSPNVESYQELIIGVQSKLEEASSNLRYLSVLSELCEDFNVPDETDASVTQILLLILFIWTESPYYNTRNNIETICRALSTQIIHQCRKYINLDIALGSSPETGISMLEKCIVRCDTYKRIYKTVVTTVATRINPGNVWDVNEEEVFNSVDTFKQRCLDVIDVCRGLIVFGKCNKVGILGGPRGTEYEAYCRKIEDLFYESLDRVTQVRDVIFDVTKSKWLRKIHNFRGTIGQLENMAINLINDMFNNITNIEEGIEAIYALQKFTQTKLLQELLANKWTQVWKIFNGEMEFCHTVAVKETEKYDQSTKDSANANILCLMQYLKTQYNIMIDASAWIGDCPIERSVAEHYKRVLNSIKHKRETLLNNYGT